MIDELSHKTISYFDKIGRLTKVERYGSGTTVYSDVHYAYNWQDKVASYTDELDHVTTYIYDYFGRQIRIWNPDTGVKTIAYNDLFNMVFYYNEFGYPVVQIFDDLGRLNSTREHISTSLYFETRMTYDAAGNLLTVRDARTQYVQVTRMTYDLLNRLTRTVYPDGFSDSATYDDAGRALTKTDREGNITTSSYDVAGNLVKLVSPSDTVIYTYDIASQRTKAQSNLGSLSYVYDSRGRVVQDTEIIGSNTYTLKFRYDAVGNRKWVLYPDNTNVTYDYDAYNRATSVKKATSTTLLTLTYNLDDSVATETTGPNTNKKLVTTYTYNKRDAPTKMETKQGSNIKLSLQYTYDTVGNIRTLTSTGGGTETFTYDWLNRLSTASAPSAYGSIAYTYDEVGNRITKVEGGTTTTYTYGMYNLLLSNGTWTFRYDPNLNQNWRNNTANTQKWNYQWNSLDQLTKVVKGIYASGQWTWTTIGEYSYDANGARAKTVESGTTIEYVFIGHNPMCEKTGTTYTDYVYVNGKVMEKLVGSNIYHYLSDPIIGSTWQVWKDGANSATSSVKCYKPFGTPYTPSGTEKVKYAGEILDASTGLYYIFARYMDPELGRFVSLDPQLGKLSMPQSMNRYVYCVNSPLRFTDPTGQWFWVAIGAAVGAIVNTAIYLATSDNPTLEGALLAAASGAVTGAVAAATFGIGTLAGRTISGAVSGGVSMAVYAGAQIATGQKITAQGLAASGAGGFVAGFIGGGKQVTSLLSIKSLGAKASAFAWQKAGIRLLGSEAMLAGIGARFAIKGALGVTGALVGTGVSMVTGDPNKPGMSDKTLGWSFVGSGLGGLGSDPWAGAPMGGTRASVEAGAWQLIGGFVKLLGTMPTYR